MDITFPYFCSIHNQQIFTPPLKQLNKIKIINKDNTVSFFHSNLHDQFICHCILPVTSMSYWRTVQHQTKVNNEQILRGDTYPSGTYYPLSLLIHLTPASHSLIGSPWRGRNRCQPWLRLHLSATGEAWRLQSHDGGPSSSWSSPGSCAVTCPSCVLETHSDPQPVG